jgi:hypothetical protein
MPDRDPKGEPPIHQLFGSLPAPLHLTGVRRLFLEVAFFGSAVTALAAVGWPLLAAALAAVVVGNAVVLRTEGAHDWRPEMAVL